MSDILQLTAYTGFQANISNAHNLGSPLISHPNMAIITINIGCKVIMMCSYIKWSIWINHPITEMTSEIYRPLIISNTYVTINYGCSVLFVIFLSIILFFYLFCFPQSTVPFNVTRFLTMKAFHISPLGLRSFFRIIIVLLVGISTLASSLPFLLF